MRWWVMAWVAATLAPRGALAEIPSAFELRWEAPHGCPTRDDVEREVAHLLGETTGTFVDARAGLRATRGGYELKLAFQQGDQVHERELKAPTCVELGHAAALVIALAINPALQDASPAASPAPPKPPPCPVVEAPPLSPPPSCPRCAACAPPAIVRAPRPWRFALLATTSIAYGELPRVTPRPGLGGSYRAGAHSFELGVGAAFGSVPNGSQRVATFSQWFVTPRYCLTQDGEHWRLGACASAELGWVRASGYGVANPKSSRALWFAPALGAQASWKLSTNTELLLGADLAVASERERFFLADNQIFRTHVLIPAVRLGLLSGLW